MYTIDTSKLSTQECEHFSGRLERTGSWVIQRCDPFSSLDHFVREATESYVRMIKFPTERLAIMWIQKESYVRERRCTRVWDDEFRTVVIGELTGNVLLAYVILEHLS